MEKYYEKRMRKKAASYKGCAVSFVGVLICLAILAIMIMAGCTTPKIVEEHHHHESKVDTMAVEAVMERRLTAVKEQMVRELYAKMQSQISEQSTQEQQKERITETVTTWVDSLGRQMRQEQRTTERDISRQQQQREERMQQEWENRLRTVTDSLNQHWDEKLKMMKGHWEEKDSAAVHQEPVPGDNRPWYKRWWDAMKWMLLGAIIFAVGWFTRKLWLPWLRLL